MAATVLADTGFFVGLLRARDRNTEWAAAMAAEFPPPWRTCEAVLTEAFHLLRPLGAPGLAEMLRREAVLVSFDLSEELQPVLTLMQKYADVPMSLADACLVHMTETHPDPIVLTTDTGFRVYRRHGRRIVPCAIPAD